MSFNFKTSGGEGGKSGSSAPFSFGSKTPSKKDEGITSDNQSGNVFGGKPNNQAVPSFASFGNSTAGFGASNTNQSTEKPKTTSGFSFGQSKSANGGSTTATNTTATTTEKVGGGGFAFGNKSSTGFGLKPKEDKNESGGDSGAPSKLSFGSPTTGLGIRKKDSKDDSADSNATTRLPPPPLAFAGFGATSNKAVNEAAPTGTEKASVGGSKSFSFKPPPAPSTSDTPDTDAATTVPSDPKPAKASFGGFAGFATKKDSGEQKAATNSEGGESQPKATFSLTNKSQDSKVVTVADSVDKKKDDKSYPFSNKTLKDTIALWKAELEEDVKNYQKQAERVKMWDQQLRENQKVLNALVDTVHRLYLDQETLWNNIDQISELQCDIDRDLNELSLEVDKELEALDIQPTEASYIREQIYTRASDVDLHLTQMREGVEKIVAELNEARGGEEAGKGSSDLSKILKVLNVHNDSLTFIESRSSHLERDARGLLRQMENLSFARYA